MRQCLYGFVLCYLFEYVFVFRVRVCLVLSDSERCRVCVSSCVCFLLCISCIRFVLCMCMSFRVRSSVFGQLLCLCLRRVHD